MCDINLDKLKQIVERNRKNKIKKNSAENLNSVVKLTNIAIKNAFELEGIVKNKDVGGEIKKYKEHLLQIENGSQEFKRMTELFKREPELLDEFIRLHNTVVTNGAYRGDGGGDGDADADADAPPELGIDIETDEKYNALKTRLKGELDKIKEDLQKEKEDLIEKIKNKWSALLKNEKRQEEYRRELEKSNKMLEEVRLKEEKKKKYAELYCSSGLADNNNKISAELSAENNIEIIDL